MERPPCVRPDTLAARKSLVFITKNEKTAPKEIPSHTSPNTAITLRSIVDSLGFLLARGFAQMSFEECPEIQTGFQLHKLSLKSSPAVYVCLPQPVFIASCGFELRGRYFPLSPNPRFSGISSNPTSAWQTLCSMVVRKCEWPHVVCGGELRGEKTGA